MLALLAVSAESFRLTALILENDTRSKKTHVCFFVFVISCSFSECFTDNGPGDHTVKKIRRFYGKIPGIWLPVLYRYFYGCLPVEHF